MKCDIGYTSLVVVFTITLVLGMAATAQAGDAACSIAQAAGTYGFTTSGTVAGVESRLSVGIFKADAAGNVTGKATSSTNGTITDETFSGTYTVNSDCTGTLIADIRYLSGKVLLTVTEDAVWDDNMREVRGIFTSAKLPDGTSLPTILNTQARKMVSSTQQ